MAYFTKKTQMQKLQSDLDALKTRATLLNAKRVAAQLAFDKAVAARQTHLLGGDLDDERISAKMQAAVDAGASTLTGLDVAISALTAMKPNQMCETSDYLKLYMDAKVAPVSQFSMPAT